MDLFKETVFEGVEKEMMGLSDFMTEMGRDYNELMVDVAFELGKRFGDKGDGIFAELIYWEDNKWVETIEEDFKVKLTESDKNILHFIKRANEQRKEAKRTLISALKLFRRKD